MPTALLVYGTRPEAIKMAPLVSALRDRGIEPVVAVTGQHREMLDQVNELFGIHPKFDLDLGRPRQSLAHITSSSVAAINEVVKEIRPDVVVVQGDTSTTFAGALAGFYEQVPIAHVEAGLRTGKRHSPFPEEINRRLTTQLATLHLAPTAGNRDNLVAERVRAADVVVTGNTVIDALLDISTRQLPFQDPELETLSRSRRRIVLVTTHRRESWGEPMRGSLGAVRRLAERYRDTTFVLPVHLNPVVRQVVDGALGGVGNVALTAPLDYGQFARLLSRSHLVLTDSGGVQEEAPGLGKPVLVLRDDTERPEAVAAGTARLVGTRADVIYREATTLLDDRAEYARMARATNPYGDGRAAPRSAAAIAALLGIGERMPDFAHPVPVSTPAPAYG